MAGKSIIIIRIDGETKRRIQDAAKQEGKSMTTFITEAAKKRAVEVSKHIPTISKEVFQGAPTFFRANCLTAQLGGEHGYETAGWHLGIHCARLLESDGHDDWARKMEELAGLLDTSDRDDKKVMAWFKREFPKCVALIPSRRRTQFLKGIYAVHEDRDITN